MLLQLSFIGNSASCHPILFVIILLIKQNRTPATSNFVDHSFDYRPNKTPLSPITIIYICKINRFVPLRHIHLMVAYHKMQKEEQQQNLLRRSVLLLPRVTMLSFQFHPLVTTSDSEQGTGKTPHFSPIPLHCVNFRPVSLRTGKKSVATKTAYFPTPRA